MLSLRKVNSGYGYEYLMASVVTNDAKPEALGEKPPSLSRYYQAKGTPPGTWYGRGLEALNSERAKAGAVVDELQMHALFGRGLHPDTEYLKQEGIDGKALLLGKQYHPNSRITSNGRTTEVAVLRDIENAELAYIQEFKKIPDAETRNAIGLEIATKHYKALYGEHVREKDVVAWLNKQKDRVKQPNAAFDFTFSPAKSISVLWALADEDTAEIIQQCHDEAVNECLARIEDECLYTRSGHGGVFQRKTTGMLAAKFVHFDTRAQDPDLHTHVLISNKVQDATDGKWKAIDGRMFFRYHQPISYRYNDVLRTLLSERLGVEFRAREKGPNKQPVWEIDGISDELIDEFSKRKRDAKPVFDKLVREWQDNHPGIGATQTTLSQLWQQAILTTRDAKKPAESLADLKQFWANELAKHPQGEQFRAEIDGVLAARGVYSRPLYDAELHHDQLIQDVLTLANSRRNTSRRSHLHTATACELAKFRFASVEERNAIQDSIVEEITQDWMFSVNGTEPLELPDDLLQNQYGKAMGFDRIADFELFVSPEIIATEMAVIDSCDTVAGPEVELRLANRACDAYEEEHGFKLAEKQREMVGHFVSSGTLTATGVGPAGTGKSTIMEVVTDIWRKQAGRNVIGLAPSAAAAEVLADSIKAPAHTIDSLVFTWLGRHPHKPGRDLSALPVEINPGDMLMIDEAGMASSQQLGVLLEIAQASGAVIRMVGDPMQLSAVENGGLFETMVTTKPTVELDKVMRFGNDTEQVEAAAKLRLGDPSALHFYKKRGWIVPDWSENLIDRAATFYMREIERGKTCLVMAGTNRLVQDLNKKIQTMRLEAGLVSHDGPTATIAEEFIIGEGDIIVTRKNKQFTIAEGSTDKVINGEQLLVQRILPDGSVLASNLSSDNHKGQWKRIPADYVAEHVQLGYASTVHRAQGATVDTAVSLVADNFNRQSLYVAMSRGKQYNLAFVALDYAFDTDAEEAHYHYLDDEQEETSEVKEEDRRIGRATAILEAIIDSDERAMSATSEEQAFADEAVSPQRLRRLWTMGRETLVEKFVAKYYPEWFNTLPQWLQDAIDYHPEDNDAVENAWAALVRVGVDPRNVADSCLGNFEGVTNIPRLLGWRMRQYLPDEYQHDKEVRAAGIRTDNTGDGARFQREIKRQDRHTRPDLKYSDLNHRERDAVVASVVSARQSKSVELVHDRRNPTRWLFPTFLTLKDKPELNAWLHANRPPVLNMAVDHAGPRATVDAYNRDMTGGCVYATRQVHHARLFDSSLTDCIIDLSQCAHMTLEGCELTNVEFVGALTGVLKLKNCTINGVEVRTQSTSGNRHGDVRLVGTRGTDLQVYSRTLNELAMLDSDVTIVNVENVHIATLRSSGSTMDHVITNRHTRVSAVDVRDDLPENLWECVANTYAEATEADEAPNAVSAHSTSQHATTPRTRDLSADLNHTSEASDSLGM